MTDGTHHEIVKTESVGGLVHEGDYDFENLLGGPEHEVVKTESLGGLVHEGDFDFDHLYAEGDLPHDSDFVPVITEAEVATEGEYEEWAEEEYKVATGEAATISSHFIHHGNEHEINEHEPLDKEEHALMVPFDED